MDLVRTVEEAARARGCRVIEFPVGCTFCRRPLSNIEKTWFDAYGMNLRWVEGTPYACCLPCMRRCARVEFTLHLQRYTSASGIEKALGTQLHTLPVRCRSCLRPLSRGEKLRHEEVDASVGIVRGRLRGICGLCETVVI